MPRHIAIITSKEFSLNYGDDSETITVGITDWTEVTDAEYELLSRYCVDRRSGKYNYFIIERLDKAQNFIPTTLAQFKKLAEAEAREKAAQVEQDKKLKVEREKLKLERAAKKALKQKEASEAAERAMLAELQRKYSSS